MSKDDKGKSPYQKYGKSPFRYSQAYQLWRDAAVKGRSNVGRLGDDHLAYVAGLRRMPASLRDAAE